MRIATSIGLLVLVLVSGCGDDPAEPPPPTEPTESAFDRQVRENCEIVATAAEAYYEDHGEYAWQTIELKPYLPDGKLLINPATGEATEPVMPEARDVLLDPWAPGSVGIRTFRFLDVFNYEWIEMGYYIVGKGEQCDIVLTNVPEDEILQDRDRRVVENCKIIAAAADAFALDNGGVYARDDRRDVNDLGLTISDYLPDGLPLTNPYREVRTEPTWGGVASHSGTNGYVALDADGDGISEGYLVDGIGSISGVTIFAIVYPPDPESPQPPDVAVRPCSGMGNP